MQQVNFISTDGEGL